MTGSARADIPVPPQALYGAPAPRKLHGVPRPILPGLALDHAPAPPEPDPDVATASRDVRVDVYLGVARVRERTVLESARPIRGMRVGFVQDRGRVHGLPLYHLRVAVGGRAVDVERAAPEHPPAGDVLEALVAYPDDVVTWEWDADVGGLTTMETSYLVALELVEGWQFEGLVAPIGYDLDEARAWRGGLGPTTLTIESHGPLELLDERGRSLSREASLEDGVATAVRYVGIHDPGALCDARAPRYPERWLAWVDALARARRCGGLHPSTADALVNELGLAAAGPPGEDREVARELLASIGREVRRSPSPSSSSEEPEWMRGDGEESFDPEWAEQVDRALTSLGPWGRTAVEREASERAAELSSSRGDAPLELPPDFGNGENRAARERQFSPFPQQTKAARAYGLVEVAPEPRVGPELARDVTSFERFARAADFGEPNAVVLARGVSPTPVWWSLLGAAVLLLPFAVGYARWRRR